MSLIREVPFGSPLYDLMIRCRDECLRHPLGLSLSADDVSAEDRQIHIAALEKDQVLGTVILKPLSSSLVKLRQMAVAPSVRGVGLGKDLLRFAEALAADRGFHDVEMHARIGAKGFYEKLGYRPVGHEFVEVTLPHVKMTKRISHSPDARRTAQIDP